MQIQPCSTLLDNDLPAHNVACDLNLTYVGGEGTLSLRAFSYLARSLVDLKAESAPSQTYL